MGWLHLQANEHTLKGCAEFLKLFVLFSTFLAGVTFSSITVFAPAMKGSKRFMGDYLTSVFLAANIFVASAVWNGFGYLMLYWTASRLQKRTGKRRRTIKPWAKICLIVFMIVAILLVLAGVAAFLTGMFSAARMQQWLKFGKVFPEFVAIPVGVITILLVLLVAGFVTKLSQ